MEKEEKRMKVIGLICEDIFTDFAKEVIRGVQNAAREHDDVRLIVLVGRQNEIGEEDKHFRYKSVYNYVYRLEESSKFDGLILTLPNFTALEMDSFGLDKIRNYGRIPKVLIATNSRDETSVNYDNESGLRGAIDYLTDVRGLHRICMLGGRDDNPDAMQRKRLFREILAEKGIEFKESDYQKTDMSVECIPDAAALLDRNPDAQAIFCVNDPAAVALYAAMSERNLIPGRDILVFGFDNTHGASTMIPPLASIGPSDGMLGTKAFEVLMDKMEGKKVSSVILPTRLFGRESCPYEWHTYEPDALLTADKDFIDRLFDNCFYRYRYEGGENNEKMLRPMFHEIINRMLTGLKKEVMSMEEFESIGFLIDDFFDQGAMNYTDASQFLSFLSKLQENMNRVGGNHIVNQKNNRLFIRMKDSAIRMMAGAKNRRNEYINSGRGFMLDFLIETTDFDRTGKDAVENIVGHFDKLGLTNAALYLYDIPVNYIYHGVTIFPDHLNLWCVTEDGKLNLIPKEERGCSVKEVFTNKWLSKSCSAYVTFPVFYGCRIYGILLCELNSDTADRGEYIVSMLSRTFYANDIEIINSPVEMEQLAEARRSRKDLETYNQIAEGLASHYDIIYYVNSASGRYTEFKANDLFGSLVVQEEGINFFEEMEVNARQIVHPEDRERMTMILGKDHMITALEGRKQLREDYRLMIEGKTQYMRLTVMWGSDRIHFIIGVENVNEEVRKEEEHVRALRMANDLARRDGLTGAKNITAYHEVEESMQHELEEDPEKMRFAIAVCDINNLKFVNDNYGHKAGDEYIKASCKLIFTSFSHSPVFRIGGDEFVVVMRTGDFDNRTKLIEEFRAQILENQRVGKGPVVAIGISDYVPGQDSRIAEVFERADQEMYQNKSDLKALAARKDQA
ncbi:MAG: GGDEF domain-containing protein [Lachnospiraceae bacterium]|nr:GGDEF domain-containing protein [Lachnospiraceae bacterium]